VSSEARYDIPVNELIAVGHKSIYAESKPLENVAGLGIT